MGGFAGQRQHLQLGIGGLSRGDEKEYDLDGFFRGDVHNAVPGKPKRKLRFIDALDTRMRKSHAFIEERRALLLSLPDFPGNLNQPLLCIS